MGMFDGLMGGKKDDDWKEEAWQAQQEIIRKRKESSGFLSDEDQLEISERRRIVNTEAKALKSVQNGEGADTLEEWKRLREEGVIKTASSGLVRDTDSGRLGSEGLFVERADEKLPYIDSGYVSEEEDFMGGIAKMLGFKKKEKNEYCITPQIFVIGGGVFVKVKSSQANKKNIQRKGLPMGRGRSYRFAEEDELRRAIHDARQLKRVHRQRQDEGNEEKEDTRRGRRQNQQQQKQKRVHVARAAKDRSTISKSNTLIPSPIKARAPHQATARRNHQTSAGARDGGELARRERRERSGDSGGGRRGEGAAISVRVVEHDPNGGEASQKRSDRDAAVEDRERRRLQVRILQNRF
eukprot:CAMPEP_0171886474 /NCGR_PEP_ID=MMETSP0992-20121227/41915_1 /TAXON_ID=483369 /ORGANISM="non described non described, Strain CCMP2098" /LENGTH=352 /DNA_ID=CAMNT_0012513125 /DNA_START=187 /DNA_END=1248 /DNA_ORIENTATION=+